MIEFFSAIANCRLDIDSVKSSYSEHPEFAPHVGENYLNNYEKILVIGEVFSTKKSISDREADESYCSYALKNKKNSTCIKIQETLLNFDENLSEDNIAFCFFIHKTEIKAESYRSNFSPKDLDDAINSLIALIELLRPQKIIYLGNQTKRTVERRADQKAFNGKTFKQYITESALTTDVISLRNLTFRQLREKYRTSIRLQCPPQELDLQIFEQYATEFSKKRKDLIQIFMDVFKKYLGKFGKNLEDDQYIKEVVESVVTLEVNLAQDIHIAKNYSKHLNEKKELSEKNLMKRLAEQDRFDLFEIEKCCNKYSKTLHCYYNFAINECAEYDCDSEKSFDFISQRLKAVSLCLAFFQAYARALKKRDGIDFLNNAIPLSVELMCKYLNKKSIVLQRLLVPIKAIKDHSIDNTDNAISSMSRKIEFVKKLVKDLRPQNNNDPGRVMSLQMVVKKLNECIPPITTTQGKKYDDDGKGVVVLLRNVYNILEGSSSQDERDIAADMLRSFTKRPVAKVFVRNDENVSEGEYWKPFKNMKNENRL